MTQGNNSFSARFEVGESSLGLLHDPLISKTPLSLRKIYNHHNRYANSLPSNYSYDLNACNFSCSNIVKHSSSSSEFSDSCFPLYHNSESLSYKRRSTKVKHELQRRLPAIPARRKNTSADFFPIFTTIPSVDCDSYSSEISYRNSYRESPPEVPKENYNREYLKLDIHRHNSFYPKENRRSDDSSSDANEKIKTKDLESFKKSSKTRENVEGKVVSAEIKAKISTENDLENKASSQSAVNKRDHFSKGSSKSSATIDSDEVKSDGEELTDNVFESPCKKNPSSIAIIPNVLTSHSRARRSSSLEAYPPNSRNKSVENRSRLSSVSIKNKLEYFEYDSPSKSSKSGKIASSMAIAKLNTKPSRGSLKKPKKLSSDYDRDRGRSRHTESGHRDSFKKNERTNEQDRDASDREQKDGSLNRSLSNTDTNLEDRIGKRAFIKRFSVMP